MLSKEEKISLFKGRTDVYAKRWENWEQTNSGYFSVFVDQTKQSYASLTEEVVEAHLRGQLTIGIYPLLTDNKSHFIVADFDKEHWQSSIISFLEICKKYSLSVSVERSRSGNGGHVWCFFENSYSAVRSRKIFLHLIKKCGLIDKFDKIVTAEFENAAVVSVTADQQALSEPLPISYASGTYQIQLYSGAEIIGSNFFEVPPLTKREVIGQSTGSDGESVYGEFTPSIQIAQVSVPLLKSVDPEATGLKILKGDSVLFDKKLSTIPLNVISASSARVLVKDPPPPKFTPSPQPPEVSPEATTADEYNPSNESKGGWFVIILLLIGATYFANKKGWLNNPKIKPFVDEVKVWLDKIKNKFFQK